LNQTLGKTAFAVFPGFRFFLMFSSLFFSKLELIIIISVFAFIGFFDNSLNDFFIRELSKNLFFFLENYKKYKYL